MTCASCDLQSRTLASDPGQRSDIPPELHEVAAIDGATAWQRFWKITLPLMRPTVVFTMVMLVIGGFNVFISVALMIQGMITIMGTAQTRTMEVT